MTPRNSALSAAVAAGVVVLALCGVPLASAEPGDPDNAIPVAGNARSSDTASLIGKGSGDKLEDALAKVHASDDQPGFGKVVVDEQASVITVYWRGDPPAAIKSVAREEPGGIRIDLASARYSAAELASAGLRLFAAGRDGGTPMSTVEPNADLSGVVARVSAMSLLSKGSLANQLEATADVPVTVEVGAPPVGTTRRDDSDPWQGGGVMHVVASGDDCSTGFAVVTSTDQGRLLSAAHCAPEGNAALEDGDGDDLSDGGADVDVAPLYDSLLIDPVGGTAGKVFGGPWNAGTGHARYQFKVAGSISPSEGETVCPSGANTGEHCGSVVENVGVMFNCPGANTLTCTGFTVISSSHADVIGRGDSGGPVYHMRDDGRVGARGIISAGDASTSSTCADSRITPSTCYWRGYMIPTSDLEDRWNVTIESMI